MRAPMVLGHESSGTVSKLGPGVNNLKIGWFSYLTKSVSKSKKSPSITQIVWLD